MKGKTVSASSRKKKMKEKMIQLNEKLKKACNVYYNTGKEMMSNFEYDKLFDELKVLEKQSGFSFPDSVTRTVGSTPSSKLTSVVHEYPALSLDKTKEISDIKKWLDDNIAVLSWKLDGSTIVATYDNGKLTKLTTRGNGITGSDILFNADRIKGLPETIMDKGHLVVRLECLMSYASFAEANEEAEADFKNPRNLANATVTAINQDIFEKRHIHAKAFNLVSGGFSDSFYDNLSYLKTLGFDVVEFTSVTPYDVEDKMNSFTQRASEQEDPMDGLVLVYNNIEFGQSLGATGHHARNGIAFKWQDDLYDSVLKEIFWSASRSGRLNPVAVFDTTEIEGTSVSRASVHNISVMKELQLTVGQSIKVFKANLIIPQIESCESDSFSIVIPDHCPVCGSETKIHVSDDGVEVLYCENPDCAAKKIGAFERFVCRDAMNIEGLSTSTLKNLIEKGFLKELPDVYKLTEHKDAIIKMEGMGQRSYDKLISAIEKSKKTTFDRVLYALGIPNIGRAQAKLIAKFLNHDMHQFLWHGGNYEYTEIDGIGEVIENSLLDYLFELRKDCSYGSKFWRLSDMIEKLFIIEKPVINENSSIAGKTFVITGSLTTFENRDDCKTFIERNGGKVSGTISKKTDYLINNDSESASGKNKKAKDLNVKIISEEEFFTLKNKVN